MPKRKKSFFGYNTALAKRDKIRQRLKRQQQKNPERECQFSKVRAQVTSPTASETVVQREHRLSVMRSQVAFRRASETEVQRERRLSDMRARVAFRRASETAEEREYRLDKARRVSRRLREERKIRLYLDRMREIQFQCASSDAPEQTVIRQDVPIVKKEPIHYTEEILPSASERNTAVRSSDNFMLSLKSEPPDECVDDMTIPVNLNSITLPAASTNVEATFHVYRGSTESSLKRPNISFCPPISNTEIKDEFSDFVASKIRSFTDQCLQVEAQNRIMNLLFEMEMENSNEDSLCMISKISGFQKPLTTTETLPPSSNISSKSSL